MMERNIPKRWEVPWERNPSFFAKILSPLFGPRGKSHLGRKRPSLEERSGNAAISHRGLDPNLAD